MVDKEYHQSLHRKTISAMRLADWIYHDVRLDCDGHSMDRTNERLAAAHEQLGSDTWFGLASAWAIRAYWRLDSGYKRAGREDKPVVSPVLVGIENSPEYDEDVKRALTSGQQFFSLICNDEIETAEAIYLAAYNSGEEDCMKLLRAVLYTSILVSDYAESLGRS